MHDSLCPSAYTMVCECDLIARVREDERMSERTRWYSVNEEADFRVAQARAAALQDAVETMWALEVFALPWAHYINRVDAKAAIEDLCHNRTENGTGLAQCLHQNGSDVWEENIPHCRQCGQDMSSQYEMGN